MEKPPNFSSSAHDRHKTKDVVQLDYLFQVRLLKFPHRVKRYEDRENINLEVVSDWKIGENPIGMVAFLCTIKTPEYPSGRDIVLIANDITYQGGSFGVEEDILYAKASEFARIRGIPRIYISSNSGARLGLFEKLKSKIQVQFKNSEDPNQGVEYLYLTSEDLAVVGPDTVRTNPLVLGNGVTRHILEDIIGTDEDLLGVENLRGSGLIAGETSQAYEETFTLSYVSGRSVGVGAYIVRLGQRVIQQQNAPIILTGFQALNKLLGRQVFVSQDQLGGPRIMHPNGVAHLVVSNDKEGMAEILRWLSYVPDSAKNLVPVVLRPPLIALNVNIRASDQYACMDDVHRDVGVYPPKLQTAFDPRELFAGRATTDNETDSHGSWLRGFFDTNSFKEYLAAWGKTTIVGRARLGGMPVAVIGVETRTVEARIPADPADPDSRESVLSQAGQVWYPDSAHKAAQAIEDFNRGENLPLFIFANWRGFSGGTRDMYGEVLKFGARIVDALRKYRHPVFVYLGPHTELRGGAWVVVDPLINIERIEMYADPNSRGGVLEPSGICEIKFRERDQLALMHRLDPLLIELDQQKKECLTNESNEELNFVDAIHKRESYLQPTYHQIALSFADMHDRCGRLLAKNAIRRVVEWRSSRRYFYWRLRRRVAEDPIKDTLRREAELSLAEAAQALEKIYQTHGVDPASDTEVAEFLTTNTIGNAAVNALTSMSRIKSARKKVLSVLDSLSKHELQNLLSQLTLDG